MLSYNTKQQIEVHYMCINLENYTTYLVWFLFIQRGTILDKSYL